ncbi:RNA ligase [Marininema halotolerans]|uniref:AAA domain-containing protein n=1 Tax=Marininema halotolerans TaxID=1155944 RepID=A0A1I6SV93_9BACL|nr:RNA ligase [Marininema halotolerans]SFS80812.1 AAA domain-containing protein [Marininema halotolerans]
MRLLVIVRGLPGVGKSTWLEAEGLMPYTLSADHIRMQTQSPVYTMDGELEITAKNDKTVWRHLFTLLEERMKRGELTVVDATHLSARNFAQYKKYCKEYRYRAVVIDFTQVALDEVLKRNRQRPSYKRVPETVIINGAERLREESLPGWLTVIPPSEWKVWRETKILDFNHWRKIHHIGDIHGCYQALMEYLQGELKNDELYIFTGDWCDRGLQNAEVLQYFISIHDRDNVILIEGNHERHLWEWSNDRPAASSSFNRETAIELTKANISKKSVRVLYRKVRPIALYTYRGKKVFVNHGGFPNLPERLPLIAAEQAIKGVGGYDVDIDDRWDELSEEAEYQIHGHRNRYRLPTKASKRSFNLEGQVEEGGHLRVVTLDETGFTTFEIKNDHFSPWEAEEPVAFDEPDLSVDELMKSMDENPLVKKKEVGENIFSYNFTTKAFAKNRWDEVNVRARGLFINEKTKEIVNRSYNKFFNIEQRPETKLKVLRDRFTYPVTVYSKPNGYLGMLGYDADTDALLFSSKSELRGPFALWFQELFYETFHEEKVNEIKEVVKEEGVSLVFEVILPEKDPHIIKYEEDHLILLDIVKRTSQYQKESWQRLVNLGEKLGVKVKDKVHTFTDWLGFYRFYQRFNKDLSCEIEGYIVEDASGLMTKMKGPYYLFWRHMRKVKANLADGQSHMLYKDLMVSEEHFRFYDWMKRVREERGENFLKEHTIIQLRDEFLEEVGKDNGVQGSLL